MMMMMHTAASSNIPVQGMLVPSFHNTLACSGSTKNGTPTGTTEALPRTTLAELDTFNTQTNAKPQRAQIRSGKIGVPFVLAMMAATGIVTYIMTNDKLNKPVLDLLKNTVNGFGKKDSPTDTEPTALTTETTTSRHQHKTEVVESKPSDTPPSTKEKELVTA